MIESESEVAQLCLTLCDPKDCSPPGSSVHGILQARILESVASTLEMNGKPDLAISFSRGSSLLQGSNQGLLHCRQILYHLNHHWYLLGNSRLTG